LHWTQAPALLQTCPVLHAARSLEVHCTHWPAALQTEPPPAVQAVLGVAGVCPQVLPTQVATMQGGGAGQSLAMLQATHVPLPLQTPVGHGTPCAAFAGAPQVVPVQVATMQTPPELHVPHSLHVPFSHIPPVPQFAPFASAVRTHAPASLHAAV
jgi:hypothetical protein